MSKQDKQPSEKPRISMGRRITRGLALSVGTLIVLVCIALVAGAFWLGTAHARDFLIGIASKQLNTDDSELIVTNASGSLLDTLSIEQLIYKDKASNVLLERVKLQWSPAQLLSLKLLVSTVEVNSASLELKATDEPAAEPEPGPLLPDSIALPIEFELSRIAVNKLSVKTPDADEPLLFTGIALAAQYGPADGGNRFLLNQVTASTPWGQLQEAAVSLEDETPFPLSANAKWQGPITKQTLNLDLVGSGSLEKLDLDATATAGSSSVKLVAGLQPLNAVLWTAAETTIRGLNVHDFAETAPRTQLDIDLNLTNLVATSPDQDPQNPPTRDRIGGTLSLTNQAAGSFPEQKLPIRSAALKIVAAFSDNPAKGTIALTDIGISLSAQPAVAASGISGDIRIDLSDAIQIANQSVPAVTSLLKFTDIDINQWLGTVPPTALAGQLALTRRELDLNLSQSAQIALQTLDFPGAATSEPPSVRILANAEKDQLLINEMRASLNGTFVQLNGQAALQAPFDISIDGELKNLVLDNWLTAEQQKISKLATGNVNATFSVNGPTQAPASTAIKLKVFDSKLGGQPLTLDTEALVSTADEGSLSRVSDLDTQLSLGKNNLSASGALGREDDELKIVGKLPALKTFDSRLAGRLNLDVSLQGAFATLRARLLASGSRLSFRQPDTTLRLRALELDADMPLTATVEPDAIIALKLKADRFRMGDTNLRRTRLNINGTPDKHSYDASVSSGKWAGRLKGQGAAVLGKQASWKTTINRLDVDGDLKARLRGRPTLTVSADRIDLQKLNLTSSAGRVAVDRVQVRLGETPDISIDAKVDDLIISDLLSLASASDVPAELGRLRAQAVIALEGTNADDLSGTITLDLDENAKRDKPKLGITPGRVLTLKANKGALDGKLAIELPSLGFSRAYTGADIKVDGAVNLKADIGGSTAKPSWVAKINGSDLAVLQRSLGWQLDKGVLNATVTQERVDLRELRIASGEGTLAITGSAKIPSGENGNTQSKTIFDGQFAIEPSRFVVPIGPGQRIAISGKTFLKGNSSGIDLTGDLLVDEGVIEVQGSGAPSAPSDLVFDDEPAASENQAKKEDKEKKKDDGGASIRADLNIDTGQKLRVVGSGIRARLVGKLKLGGVLPDAPRLTGRVDVSDGSYRAYGQALDIKRGIVRFNGPADNPNLDILAIRPNLPVEVGVSVNGTAAVPTIELVSSPELPNAEKLSWLVLGTGLDSAPGAAQSLALQQAAKSLIGAGSDEQGGIAERLGFDSLGLGYASETGPAQGVTDSGGPKGLPGGASTSSSVSAEEVVTVGRQLSSKVRISYEQGLRGVQNLLRIQYDVSKRLAVRAQTGSDNAVDLLYFFSFD